MNVEKSKHSFERLWNIFLQPILYIKYIVILKFQQISFLESKVSASSRAPRPVSASSRAPRLVSATKITIYKVQLKLNLVSIRL